MRLSEKHYKTISEMKAKDYVWLSDLSKNAIMRFRNKTRNGFNGYVKVNGLTFLTRRVADSISRGAKDSKPRLTLKQQNVMLENDLIELERRLYKAERKEVKDSE